MSIPTEGEEELEQIPGFTAPRTMPASDPLDTDLTTMSEGYDDPSTPSSPPQLTTSTQTPGPDSGQDSPKGNSPSSTASIEPDVGDALGDLGKVAALLVGVGVNKATHQPKDSTKWLMTEEEAETIGGALARMGARRVPEQLVEGENAEILVIGITLVNYGSRNLLDASPEQMAEAMAVAQTRGELQRTAPPPRETPPPSSPPPPTRPKGALRDLPADYGVAEAAPEPPSVIAQI